MNTATIDRDKFQYALNKPVYLALLDSDENEIKGESYRRMPVVFLLDSLDPRVAYNYALEFPESSGDWEDVYGFALLKKSSVAGSVVEIDDVLLIGDLFNVTRLGRGHVLKIPESSIMIQCKA